MRRGRSLNSGATRWKRTSRYRAPNLLKRTGCWAQVAASMLLPGCGLRSWHIVQKERCDDSPQTSLSACRGGVPPPPPTSVTGVLASGGAGTFVLPLAAATTPMRTRTAVVAPRAAHVVRRRKRLFFSELNDAPSAGDGRVRSSVIEHDSPAGGDVRAGFG